MSLQRDFRENAPAQGFVWRTFLAIAVANCLGQGAFAQRVYTWTELRDRFLAANPTLQAAQINVNETRAQEITAYLRPNPDFTLATDGTQLTPYEGVWRPFTGTQFSPTISYLHERGGKRE